jgi:hypothetical protein
LREPEDFICKIQLVILSFKNTMAIVMVTIDIIDEAIGEVEEGKKYYLNCYMMFLRIRLKSFKGLHLIKI